MNKSNIFTITTDGNEKLGWKAEDPKPLSGGSSLEDEALFSPDGRWLAYQGD